MSENEIDSLEIVVEAEANRANRALSGLEKRINKAATALEKFMVMAQGGVSFKNVDVDKLFSGNAMDKAARSQGKKLADELISGFNLNKATPEVQRQVRELSQKIAGGLSANGGRSYSGLSTDLEALGKITAKNGSVAKSTSEEYQKLYNWIKTTSKIKIAPETAKSLGDAYKNRVPVMKQKLSTKGGIELDSFYNEAKDMFPGLLKDAYSVEDEFYQLNSALEKFYETSKSFYKPEWLEDAAYENVISGVNDIVAGIEKAKSESSDLTGSLKGVADTGKSFSDIFGAGMDTSGLERIVELTGSVRSQNTSTRSNRNDVKYPVQEFETLVDKFKDSSLGVDFSGMDSKQLQSKLAEYERAYERIWQSISDIRELEGTDTLGGKDWYKKIMQMNQYSNAIDEATNALKELQNVSNGGIPINHFNANDTHNDSGSDVSKTEATSGKFMGYDPEAMKAVFGEGAENLHNYNDVMKQFGETAFEAFDKLNDSVGKIDTSKMNTFEAQIKSLKQQLAELASQGFSQHDPEYDKVARELAEVQVAKKQYDQEMQKSVKAEMGADEAKRVGNSLEDAAKKANFFKRTVNSIKGAAKNVNSVKKAFDNAGKSIRNAKDIAGKAIHPFRTLKELMGSSNGGKKNGMSFGRMIGSSIMFSTIFGAISQIKQAVKEGSDNLVQYSSEYNKSISGMVSSLLYLKNAWAVAFAPVVNVVGPYIESFIDMLASALNAVGQFMAALTGKGFVVQAKKAWKDYGASIADSSSSMDKANNSAKQLKRTILGFDELNILNGDDGASGSGSGSGSGGKYTGPSASDMFETIEVPNSMNKLVDKFKEAIKNSDFTDIGRMLSDKLSSAMESIKWNEVYHKADNFGKDLATFLNGLISPRLFYDLGATIAGSINTALHAANSFAVNFDWKNLGDSLAASVTGFFENWDAGLTGETFSHFVMGILEAITGFLDGLGDDKTWEKIGQKLVDFICGVDWKGLAWDLIGFFKGLYSAFVRFPADFARGVAQEIVNKIFGENKIEIPEIKWFDFLYEHIMAMNIRQLPLFDMLFDLKGFKDFADNASEFYYSVRDYFAGKIEECGGDIVAGLGKGILDALGDAVTWIDKHFPIIKAFKQFFGIHSPSTVFEKLGGYIMDGLSNGVTEKLQPILDFFGDLKDSIVEKFDDVKDWFGEKFGSARTKVEDKFSDIGSWFTDRKKDIQNGLKDTGDWIGSKFSTGRKNVNSAFSDIGSWFTSRKTDIQNGTKDIDTWMQTKYTAARTNVNNAFKDSGQWFGQRKSDIQNNMNSISDWFDTKYRNARSLSNAAFQNIGSWFGSRRNDIQNNMSSISEWFRSTFQSAYRAITGIFDNIGSYFWGIAEKIKSPIRNALNGVISGVNWVLGKLGSGTRFDYVNFATGTGADGVAHDTLGVVNDQTGNTYRELVQFPNGKTIIPTGRNVMLPMPKGTKVLPADKTETLMKMRNIPHFKSGIGDFFGNAWAKFRDFTGDVLDYVENPRKLMQIAIDKFTDLSGALEPGLSMAKGATNAVFDAAVSKIKGLLSEFGSTNVKYNASAGVEQWRSLAKRALQMTGQYSASNLNRLLMQMQSESGGNPNAINLWDSNAKAGIPSKGLMQVIDPTFRSYALAPYNKNIYDPLSNILAAIRYTVSRYGSLARGWNGHGYADGGFPVNGEVYVANENGFGSEYIGKLGNHHVVANNQQIVDGIKQGVIDAMMEVYIATAGNDEDSKIPIILNAVLKTEDNEVLARAVEKGQISRNSRFNPSPAY